MPWRASATALYALALTGCMHLLRPAESCERARADSADAWGRYVAVTAELRAIEQYPQEDPASRAIYVAAAQAYYAREYELRLACDPKRPAVAARLALQAAWRPGR